MNVNYNDIIIIIHAAADAAAFIVQLRIVTSILGGIKKCE